MYKTKFTLLSKDWETIHTFKSRIKPIINEYLYVGELKTYFKVLNVVHSIDKTHQIILVVEKVKNINKKS